MVSFNLNLFKNAIGALRGGDGEPWKGSGPSCGKDLLGARWTQVVMGGWETGTGRFHVRQIEFERTSRIQVKLSSVLYL